LKAFGIKTRQARFIPSLSLDFLEDIFGLSAAKDAINSVIQGATSQFTTLLSNILFSGREALKQAKDVANELLKDLKEHAGNTAPYVEKAIAALQAIAKGSSYNAEARFLPNLSLGFLEDIFGLSKAKDAIAELSSGVQSQFLALFTQLLFAGKQAFEQAKQVAVQLKDDLFEHATNSGPYVQKAINALKAILEQSLSGNARNQRFLISFLEDKFGLNGIAQTLEGLKGSIQSQFFGTLETLIFAGKDAWSKTKDVLAQLVSDLTTHTKDAAPYVQKAIAALQQILADKSNFKIQNSH
jgi:hypothetical protein